MVPANTQSSARDHMRGSFGQLARAWSGLLTQAHRDAWNTAGPNVQSAKRLGKSGLLTGQQHFEGINSARARVGLDMLWLPPALAVFDPNPVGQLIITNGEDGVRLLVNISRPLTEDIMVFGQAPCSAGRSKRRNVSYLGLVSASQASLADITALYTARYGEPRPGQKVFIVTRQEKNGWESYDHVTSEIVPEVPGQRQATATAALPLQSYMHKGCTRDAQGNATLPVPESQATGKPEGPGKEEALAGFRKAGVGGVGVEPQRRAGVSPAPTGLRRTGLGRRDACPALTSAGLAGQEQPGNALDLLGRATEGPDLGFVMAAHRAGAVADGGDVVLTNPLQGPARFGPRRSCATGPRRRRPGPNPRPQARCGSSRSSPRYPGNRGPALCRRRATPARACHRCCGKFWSVCRPA